MALLTVTIMTKKPFPDQAQYSTVKVFGSLVVFVNADGTCESLVLQSVDDETITMISKQEDGEIKEYAFNRYSHMD